MTEDKLFVSPLRLEEEEGEGIDEYTDESEETSEKEEDSDLEEDDEEWDGEIE
ncbi:MAG: hypothetical protein PHE52_01370 [Candidatus Pacebacteria bacterium]|nr:hypothetical protein [Candidatus Paceibacterota bacterium]